MKKHNVWAFYFIMNNFFKWILPCACAAMLSFTACGDDDTKGGEGTELTPDQNKQKFESIGLETMGKINAADHAELLQTVDAFFECADEGGLEVDRREEMDVVKGLLANIRAVCAKSDLGKVAQLATANYDLYKASEFYGTYTYDSQKMIWNYTSNDTQLKFVYNANGKSSVVVLAASGNETLVNIDDENDVMVPEKVEAVISSAEKELCKLTVDLKVDNKNKTADINTQLTANGYVFHAVTKANKTTATANFTLNKNNETLISATADLTGENMTDQDAIEGAIDNDNVQDLFKSANVTVNIINQARVTASCSNFSSLINLLDELDEEYTWQQQCGEEYNKKVADAYNKYVDAKLYYTSDDVIANFKMQVYYDEDDYYNEYDPSTGSYVTKKGTYDTEAAIVFTVDDSAYSFDSYFDEVSFNDLINSAEALEKQYEKYLKYLCD